MDCLDPFSYLKQLSEVSCHYVNVDTCSTSGIAAVKVSKKIPEDHLFVWSIRELSAMINLHEHLYLVTFPDILMFNLKQHQVGHQLSHFFFSSNVTKQT